MGRPVRGSSCHARRGYGRCSCLGKPLACEGQLTPTIRNGRLRNAKGRKLPFQQFGFGVCLRPVRVNLRSKLERRLALEPAIRIQSTSRRAVHPVPAIPLAPEFLLAFVGRVDQVAKNLPDQSRRRRAPREIHVPDLRLDRASSPGSRPKESRSSHATSASALNSNRLWAKMFLVCSDFLFDAGKYSGHKVRR